MQYRLKIKALSPIHIGTGDQISPFDYIIKDQIFYRIDLASFLSKMSSALKQKFETAVNNSNLLYMRKFIADNIDVDKYCLYQCDVNSEVAQQYHAKFHDINNQCLINMFVRSGLDSRPVVPGSSIKGAIRTAIVSAANNAAAANGSKPPRFTKDNRWESVPLKYDQKRGERYSCDIRKDPFRAISISDIYLEENSTIIDEAKMISKDCNPKSSGIVQYYEQTFSSLDNEDISGTGTLNIDKKLQKKTDMLPISAESIIKTCNEFYHKRIKEEHQKFYRKDSYLEQISNQLLNEKPGQSEFLIRLGRYSHCECVTIDPPYMNPQTPRRKGRQMPYGTTRTLAAGEYPFGWAKMTLEQVR